MSYASRPPKDGSLLPASNNHRRFYAIPKHKNPLIDIAVPENQAEHIFEQVNRLCALALVEAGALYCRR